MSKFKTRVRKGRMIDGIINLDKPLGLSSNQALQKVKNILQAQKAGHTGALDPLASGVLPLCFGHATKISSYLLDSDKRYRAVLQLGSVTNTGDKEGEVIHKVDVPHYSDNDLQRLVDSFKGSQQQIPPMYSAVKHQGQPLYKLARRGQEIARKVRDIHIYELSIENYNKDCLSIDVKCSKGTYIRTLAEDMGKMLGCGAHLAALRRTEAGPFELDSALSVEQIIQAVEQQRLTEILLPTDMALQNFSSIHLIEQQSSDICFGRKILLSSEQVADLNPSEFNDKQKYRLYDQHGIFLGLGVLSIESSISREKVYLNPKRMFF